MKKFWVLFFIFWPAVAVLACWYAPAMDWWFPDTNGPTQGQAASPLGRQIDDLFYLILVIVAVTFIGTQIAMGYVLWTGSRDDDGRKALFTHGSHNLEVMWTIVPAGILLFIALYQMDVWAEYRVKASFPEEAVSQPVAELTARQFEWRIRYPAPDRKFKNEADIQQWLKQPEPGDLYTVNDLRVPSNRPVMVYLRSDDVQHALFIPRLRVKQDAVPGLIIPVWFEARNTVKSDPALGGVEYEFLCAELCGWGHYKMEARLVAQPEATWRAWLQQLQRDQFDDGVADEPQTEEEVEE